MNTRTFFLDNTFENEDWPKRTQDITDYPLFPSKVRVGFVAGALVASCELHGEFACNSKACAPPPVGTGGSMPSKRSAASRRSVAKAKRTEFGKRIAKMISDDPELTRLSRAESDPKAQRKRAYAAYHAELREAIARPLGDRNRNLIDPLIQVSNTGGSAELHQKVLDLFKPEMLQDGYRPEPYSNEESAFIVIREVLLDKKKDSLGGIVTIDGKSIYFSIEMDQRRLIDAVQPPTVRRDTVRSVIGVGSKVREEINQRLKSHPLLSVDGGKAEGARHATEMAAMKEELKQRFPTVEVDWGKTWVGATSRKVMLPSSAVTAGHFYRQEVEDFLNEQIVRQDLRDFDESIHVNFMQSEVRSSLVLNTLKEVRSFGGVPNFTVDASMPESDRKKLRSELNAGADGLPSTWVEMSNEFGMMTAVYITGRGQYHHAIAKISLTGKVDVARHELTHRMEYTVAGLRELEAKFYEMRTVNDYGWTKLQDLYPNSDYGWDEITKPDKFWDAYAGKWYEDRAFEIMSMGTQYVYQHAMDKAQYDADIIQKTGLRLMDDEYMDFVLGTMLVTQWEG